MEITFKLAHDVLEGDKLTPQARQMVQLIKDSGDAGITRDVLVAELTKVVKTRQPVSRIVAFYAQILGPKGSGLIVTDKASTAKPVKKSKKEAAETVVA